MRARSENFLASYLFGPAAAMVLVLISGFGHLAGAGSVYLIAAESALLRDYPSPDSGIVAALRTQ